MPEAENVGPNRPSEELDRKDLKIRALLQKLTEKENDIADLRVELTILSDQLEKAESGEKKDGDNEAL